MYKYKNYIIGIVFLLFITFTIFNTKDRISNYFSKKEIKTYEKEYKNLEKKYQKNIDSILYYKVEYERYKQLADSSKIKTIYIKEKTKNEISKIPSLPFDTNVLYFSRELEEYLSNR